MYSLAERPRIETVNKIVQYVQANDLNKGMVLPNIGTILTVEECLNNVKVTLTNSMINTNEVYFSKFERIMVE
ncbi:hypothetical protein OO013_05235 [Mangrovivirga sp. M17]|uniref:Uncharacterized protein n=1 Tax=Mangrovivirga halotolerans TaxID=2993936 RepID=A0ABT3RP48_9BACT|nr:hypothetical protein [Mangrovivirga halotolerans]MCX2743256.1 hypothetical protein [Mangrovivirga halotolerans]